MTQTSLSRPLAFLLLFLSGLMSVSAQEARVSEKELELQAGFIEAERDMVLGRPEKAVTRLAELARKQPGNDGIAFSYARALAATGDLPGALREIRRARKLDPANLWYAEAEAEYLDRAGGYREAAELFKGLVEKDPRHEAHYLQWAFFLIKDGRSGEALKVYDLLEQRLGPSTETSRRKYMLLRGMGLAREAVVVLESVIARQPRNTEVMFLLAEFLAESGAAADARKWYQRILEIHPGNVEAQLAFLQISDPSQPEEQPLQGLGRIFADRQTPIDQKIKALIPHIQEFANTRDEGLGRRLDELSSQLDQAHPREPKVAAIRGDLAYYRGDWNTAIGYYQDATRGDRQVYAVWEQLLSACSEAGRFRDQAEWAERAADLFPNQGRVQFFLAEAQLERHQLEEALDAIRMGRMMARRDGYLLYHLAILEGRIQADLDDKPAAASSFGQALLLNARGPEALAWRSIAEADPGRACELAAEVAAIDPAMPLVRFAQARCALKTGNPGKAREQLVPLLARPYPHPRWLEAMGDLLLLEGDPDEARRLWQAAADLGLDHPGLRKKLNTPK